MDLLNIQHTALPATQTLHVYRGFHLTIYSFKYITCVLLVESKTLNLLQPSNNTNNNTFYPKKNT